MELTDKSINEFAFEEVDTDELYGDGWFIGGAACWCCSWRSHLGRCSFDLNLNIL